MAGCMQRESKGTSGLQPFKGKSRQSGVGLAGLNNVSRLWRGGVVPSWLGPGPGVIRAGGEWPQKQSPIKIVGGLGSESVGLHMKGIIAVELFASSKN